MIRKGHKHTETDSADVCPIFSDVEVTYCLYNELDDKLPVVDAWIARYITGTVHDE